MLLALPQTKVYTEDDYYNLPEDVRAELIEGQLIYNQAAPSTIHQIILGELHTVINNYIKSKSGSCRVFPAPFAVQLHENKKTIVEPDISVICNRDKITEKGCTGAPDWIIEIISPSTSRIDYGVKLFKYRTAGVREYWIVNPVKKTVTVYDFENEEKTNQYDFDETIASCIYDDLKINIAGLL